MSSDISHTKNDEYSISELSFCSEISVVKIKLFKLFHFIVGKSGSNKAIGSPLGHYYIILSRKWSGKFGFMWGKNVLNSMIINLF